MTLILNINDISYSPNNSNNFILNNFSYKIQKEDFVILLGKNGSGKSTLLNLIHNVILLNSGQIYFNDRDIQKIPKKEFLKKVKILTQNCDESLFSDLTLYENFLLLNVKSRLQNKSELKKYLCQFNENLSLKLDQKVCEFSGGEKQTLALALIMLDPPELLLLDEHTSALDPKTAELNMKLTHDLVLKYKMTCLLTTHNLNIAQNYGNRILGLQNGKIYKSIEKDAKGRENIRSIFNSFY